MWIIINKSLLKMKMKMSTMLSILALKLSLKKQKIALTLFPHAITQFLPLLIMDLRTD